MPATRTPWQAVTGRDGYDPARPLVTYYDDATGERTELSGATVGNWVAKAANLLQDDLGVEPGDRVAVLLPAHWQAACVLLAAWEVGALVTAAPGGAAVTFADADRARAAAVGGDAGQVLAVSLDPLGRGLPDPPPGTTDYASQVRVHGDLFAPYEPVDPDAPALDPGGGAAVLTGRALLDLAARRAGELGIGAGDRVLSTLEWDGPAGWVDGLLAPLAAGASLVHCARPGGEEALDRRARDERVTATIRARVSEPRKPAR